MIYDHTKAFVDDFFPMSRLFFFCIYKQLLVLPSRYGINYYLNFALGLLKHTYEKHTNNFFIVIIPGAYNVLDSCENIFAAMLPYSC